MDNGRRNDACKDAPAANSGGGGGGATAAPARPHWRHRDRSATAFYVVHPSQFRTVVQQLTGATTSPQQDSVHGGSSSAGGGGNASLCSASGANAEPARKSDVHERRTLAQLYHDCMAWADDH